MSAQLLICKFTLFTLFLLMAHVTCMVRLLSRPTLDCFQINRHVFISLCLILLLFLKITMHMLQLSIGLSGGLHKIKKWVLSMSKKDKMVDDAPRRLCKYHPHLNGANFCGEGTSHFRSSGGQIWKLIWNEQKIVAWSYGPYIYAKWLSKYSIRWCS